VDAKEERPEVGECGGSPLQRACLLCLLCAAWIVTFRFGGYGGYGDCSSRRVCWSVVAELDGHLTRWSVRKECATHARD
jgi:hypothetical protein